MNKIHISQTNHLKMVNSSGYLICNEIQYSHHKIHLAFDEDILYRLGLPCSDREDFNEDSVFSSMFEIACNYRSDQLHWLDKEYVNTAWQGSDIYMMAILIKRIDFSGYSKSKYMSIWYYFTTNLNLKNDIEKYIIVSGIHNS